MMNDAFERAFSDYLDSAEYDRLTECLFAAARSAFLAGWQAAGGTAFAKERPNGEMPGENGQT